MKKYKDCPIFDETCPYCSANGECLLDHPEDDCDDYQWFHNDPVEEDGEDE